MPLNEHVYCVAIAFKMTEQVEQQICIRFCSKLEHSSVETIQVILFRWFRRPQLWATGDWHLHHDDAPTYTSCLVQSFLAKHQITQVTQSLYSSDLAPGDFWLFPKLKSPLKGKIFQTVNEIQENMTGQVMVIGRIVWVPKVPTFKGTEVSLSYVQCFLYLVSSVSVSIFHITWLDTLMPCNTYKCKLVKIVS